MIHLILWRSRLIHQQIRAVWVPATRSCAITNVETCRYFYVNLLVTDVILLSIMLVGLLRFHHGVRRFSHISDLLWKQVGHCWFSLVVTSLSHHIWYSWGCYLAHNCHRRRTPPSGEPDKLYYCTRTFFYLLPFHTVTVAVPFFECEL